MFGDCPGPKAEMVKFNINKEYNGKTRRDLNNQHSKIPYPSEEQRVFKLCFSIFLNV